MSHAELPFWRHWNFQTAVTDLGLYIHVPFCKQRCHFCAFYLTIHREDLVRDYLAALEQEIVLYGRELGHVPVTSIYFGGGTPTSLAPDELMGILEYLSKAFPIEPHAEMTVEASPDTVSKRSLEILLNGGVNRLSVGLQSFDESEWEKLGRSGCQGANRSAIECAHEAGFQNISVDLMYGLPGQTLESWQRSLTQAVDLAPTHVSCYALMIEEGTRFHRDYFRSDLCDGLPCLQNSMEELAVAYLSDSGYRRYEISNFCQPRFECQHNMRYWSGQHYLGLGPSAQSYVGGVRFGNVEDLREYGRQLSRKAFPVTGLEPVTRNQADRERVVFGLRMIEGVNLQDVHHLARDLNWRMAVNELIKDGLLCEEDRSLRLTEVGRRVADSVAVQLL